MIFVLKLLLAPISVFLATLAARRFGHAASGLLSGFPIIAGPIIIALMLEMRPHQVADIATATLGACPAAIAHIVSFAWLSRRLPWWGCLTGASIAFLAVGSVTTAAWMPVGLQAALAIAGPFAALALLPRAATPSGGIDVPRGEIVMRVGAAFVLAATVILSANYVPPTASGLLLAWPISGSILPSFTLPTYGHAATAALLRGFAIGLTGFVSFFVALALLLRAWNSNVLAFMAAAAVSIAVGWLVHRSRIPPA